MGLGVTSSWWPDRIEPSCENESCDDRDAFDGKERRLGGGVGRGETVEKKSSVKDRPEELAGGAGDGAKGVAKKELVLDDGVTSEPADANETCASSGVSTDDTLSERDEMELFDGTERRLGGGVGRGNGAEKKSAVKERLLEV